MSEPIKVGDLVMVVRGHECLIKCAGGHIFTVTKIVAQIGGGWFCEACIHGGIAPNEKYGAAGFNTNDPGIIPLGFLRKIDPPVLDETTDETEKLTA